MSLCPLVNERTRDPSVIALEIRPRGTHQSYLRPRSRRQHPHNQHHRSLPFQPSLVSPLCLLDAYPEGPRAEQDCRREDERRLDGQAGEPPCSLAWAKNVAELAEEEAEGEEGEEGDGSGEDVGGV